MTTMANKPTVANATADIEAVAVPTQRRDNIGHRDNNDRRRNGTFVQVFLANATSAAARAFVEGLRSERPRSPPERSQKDYRHRSDR